MCVMSLLRLTALATLVSRTGAVSQASDWLVKDISLAAPTTLDTTSTPGFITLSNGLLSRTFSTSPCFATVDLELLSPPRAKLFRGLSPEAQLTLNGTAYDIGGCGGQQFYDAFNLDTVNLTQPGNAFRFVSFTTSPPTAPYPWVPGVRHSNPSTPWPPKGLHLAVTFAPPVAFPDFNNSGFAQFLDTGYGCAPTCLTGWPTCDNTSLPGQCAWPRDEAVAQCAAWPACLGVNCHLQYPYCTARQGPVAFAPFSDYVSYVRVNTSLYAFGDTQVIIHYELYDGLPVLRKWVEVVQGAASPGPVVVDDLIIEQLRAPNFVPDQITVMQIQPNNPTPFDEQLVPDPNQSFPGRTQQLWFFDPLWDQGGDAELHVPYTYYSLLKVGYGGEGPGAAVTPGGSFQSISTRFVYHDTSDWERQGLGIRKTQALLAPQLMENPSRYMITDISSNASFQLAITQAAAGGFELVIVGYGAAGYCGMCPGQLQDPAWVAWFKSNVDFARALGVGVSAYTLMQHNGWGESVPGPEQVMNPDGSRAGIACFATDWWHNYSASVLAFVAEVGLAGVETDGQYEGAECSDEGGDHRHGGLRGSWDAQTRATADFNIALKGLGGYQTGADAYLWSGANSWNHADTDAGFNVPGLWHKLEVGRDYVYDSTTSRLKTSGMYGVTDLAGQSMECGPAGTPARLACIDFALASFFANGVLPNTMGPYLVNPKDTDAGPILGLFKTWNAFYAAHRGTLAGHASLHLGRPTSRTVEATAHIGSNGGGGGGGGGGEVVLLSLFNPTDREAAGTVAVSLYYAGLAPGAGVGVFKVTPGGGEVWVRNTTVGGDAEGGVYEVVVSYDLQGKSYGLFSLTAL